MSWQQIALPGLASCVVTMLVTPLLVRFAHRIRALDVPGGRKRHERSTPRLGGIAIFGGIVVVLGPAAFLFTPSTFDTRHLAEFGGFALAVGLIFAIGVADDLLDLRAGPKLVVQTVAASIVVAMGWQFHSLRLPGDGGFELGLLAPVLSVLWIVGVTNAINFIDGLDGLAAGVVAIIGGSLLVLAALQGSAATVVVTSTIVGACLGFLRHNWCPAKIYMGDSGSLTLGFLLATISLRATPSVKASAALAILVPVLALGLPVIDTLLVMWYRFLRGHRVMNRLARMFHADRAHLHHLLLDGRKERRAVMITLFGMAALFCLMAIFVATSDSWAMGIGFLVVEILAVVLVRRIGLKAEAERVAARHLHEIDDEVHLDPDDAGGRLDEEPDVESPRPDVSRPKLRGVHST